MGIILLRFGSYTSKLIDEEQKRLIRNLADRVEERTTELNRSRDRIIDLLEHKEQMFRDLMISDEYKKNFMGLVSHELRTPLTVIRGYLTLINDGVIPTRSPEFEEVLETSIKEARKLEAIINNILELSQLDRGHLDLVGESFLLEELFEEAIENVRSELEISEFSVQTFVDSAIVDFYSDRLKILQVVNQFLSNAVKFSSNSGPIALRASPSHRGLLISVEDKGVGIPSAQAADIFNLFYQVDISSTRNYEGSGIGLAIVKKISQILGGRVWVESEINEGSTFFFEIPAIQQSKDPSASFIEYEEIDHTQVSKGWSVGSTYRNVMVVDDDDEYLELIRKLLVNEGYTVQMCRNGLDALNRLYGLGGSPLPSLILLDVRMPDIQGTDLCRIIRRNNLTREIPVIMISALAGRDHVEEGLNSGANAYMVKPFDVDEVLSRMEFLLGGSEK